MAAMKKRKTEEMGKQVSLKTEKKSKSATIVFIALQRNSTFT